MDRFALRRGPVAVALGWRSGLLLGGDLGGLVPDRLLEPVRRLLDQIARGPDLAGQFQAVAVGARL